MSPHVDDAKHPQPLDALDPTDGVGGGAWVQAPDGAGLCQTRVRRPNLVEQFAWQPVAPLHRLVPDPGQRFGAFAGAPPAAFQTRFIVSLSRFRRAAQPPAP